VYARGTAPVDSLARALQMVRELRATNCDNRSAAPRCDFRGRKFNAV